MKPILALSALALVCAAVPAGAQDCMPSDGQSQAQMSMSMPGQQSRQGMMMCGGTTGQHAQQQEQQPQQRSGMCPCCRNMSMMRPQQQPHHPEQHQQN
jgi:hypothetical protein